MLLIGLNFNRAFGLCRKAVRSQNYLHNAQNLDERKDADNIWADMKQNLLTRYIVPLGGREGTRLALWQVSGICLWSIEITHRD